MRFSSYINNQRCLEWGLNANQGALFDLLNQAAAWAQEVVIDGVVFYWVSRNEVIKELPLFYAKPDTVYRHFVELDKKQLIEYRKIDGKDLIRLTPKGKMWNEFNSEINPNNAQELGNKSEKTRIEIRKSSDLNPTNNNTNYKNTNDHNIPPISPQGEKSPSPEEFNQAFEEFWHAGMVKLNKPKALKSFKTSFAKTCALTPMSLAEFTALLVSDVQRRLRSQQFGFDKLHPTTYLNNQRWLDELPCEAPSAVRFSGNSTQSFADNGSWSVGRKLNIDPNLIPEELR